jgi:serine/threonine protein kinase
MSLLYLGLREENEVIVIKVLSPQFLTHPEMVQHFLKEAEIIALTNHPNIVKLYGQGEWEGGVYIAMEFIRGISLRQFIIQQSFSLRKALEVVLQVAYALLHLHTHGVIHRDLKPENILMTETGEVKVIDFGIAQVCGEPIEGPFIKQTRLMGTPNYMSPEQKENPLNVTVASDIYSLGVIAYELLIGKISYGYIDLLLVPKGLRKILEKCLEPTLEKRYRDIVDLITDISNYLRSSSIDKDRSGIDRCKEMIETLKKAQQNLSPQDLPKWNFADIGLAKTNSLFERSLYWDFFKFPDNTAALLIAESMSQEIDAAIYIGVLRGMVRQILQSKLQQMDKPFNVIDFVTELNQLILSDPIPFLFSLRLLKLDPTNETFSFVSCGHTVLLHLAEGQATPRLIVNNNPLLGQEPLPSFDAASDNWRISDKLLFSNLYNLTTQSEKTEDKLTQILQTTLFETLYFSAQRQAETLLKKLLASSLDPFQKESKVLFCFHRFS